MYVNGNGVPPVSAMFPYEVLIIILMHHYSNSLDSEVIRLGVIAGSNVLCRPLKYI